MTCRCFKNLADGYCAHYDDHCPFSGNDDKCSYMDGVKEMEREMMEAEYLESMESQI